MNRILIVEDDYLSQKILRVVFKHNYEVDFCESSNEYYEKYSDIYYNIILMDVSIRGNKSGLQLMKEIKAVPLHSSTSIICLTGHTQVEIQQLATESGADIVITKPVSISVIKEEVESLMKLKELV